jgi:hypothetical protein
MTECDWDEQVDADLYKVFLLDEMQNNVEFFQHLGYNSGFFWLHFLLL